MHWNFCGGFNDLPTELVPLGFQQLIQVNGDESLPPDKVDITSSDLEFFVYPFADKEIIDVPVLTNDKNEQFGLQLCNNNLYDRIYIKKIEKKSSVDKAFNKSTINKLKGSFITHINNDPVFSIKDASKTLKKFYEEHIRQNQRVAEKFSFSITFALEKKLLGPKFKKAIDEYYGYTLGTTKNIKSKPERMQDMDEVDDGSTRFVADTKIFKIFNDVEYKGTVTGYDHKLSLYHILYENNNDEDFYHNKV